MMAGMKSTILFAVLLVGSVQAIAAILDYCGIEPLACASHVFNVPNNPGDSFTCDCEPLQYNGNSKQFEPAGSSVNCMTDVVVLNAAEIRCDVSGTQAANVTLKNGSGQAVGDAIIYPSLCFQCNPNMSLCTIYQRFTQGTYYVQGGCYVDSMCYPNHVLNPANGLEWCDSGPFSAPKWQSISTAADQFFYGMVDMCHVTYQSTGTVARAVVPDEAGSEGLDITAPGASMSPYLSSGSETVETNIKFYVKFEGVQPFEGLSTFFEFPSMLKIQRRSGDAIVMEVKFVDGTGNQDANASSAEISVPVPTDSWNLIGLAYNIYEQRASIKLYVNGAEFQPDFGDTTGKYLRVTRGAKLSNGQFSCIEGAKSPDVQFFSSPTFTYCHMQHERTNAIYGGLEARMALCLSTPTGTTDT